MKKLLKRFITTIIFAAYLALLILFAKHISGKEIIPRYDGRYDVQLGVFMLTCLGVVLFVELSNYKNRR